jgi:hypothetical protein
MSGNRGNLMSAIRGPIMLITVGALFAVDHFGPYGIGHTWPVILIVFGLLKLAERATMGPPTAGDPTKWSAS